MQHQQHLIGMETYISNDNSIWCSHYGKLFPIRTKDENRNGPRKKMTGKFQSESFYFVLFPVKGSPYRLYSMNYRDFHGRFLLPVSMI